MSDKPNDPAKPAKPALGNAAQAQAAAREARRAAALRANLQRRKGQDRARQEGEETAAPNAPISGKTPDI
ncbi:MAG TPA: hypothetical protein VGO34_02495 [Alphaproteobacteria bacterium]|jgi:hypothetical protein